jgi:hypothetical protein
VVVGGEGGEAGELQGAKRYLLVGSGRGGGGRRWVIDGEQWRSTHGIDGEGALVGNRQRGEVDELREGEAELEVRSAWAEEVGNGGSTESSSSPACGWTAEVFWGFGEGS